MVEVATGDGGWAFFDPTFGTYFDVDRHTPSLEQIRFTPPAMMSDSVRTARAGELDAAMGDVTSLYVARAFNFPNMTLMNYWDAEIGAQPDIELTVPLVMRLQIERGSARAGVLELTSLAEMDHAFLRWTNETLGDDDPSNDVSYHFSRLDVSASYYAAETIIQIDGLEPGNVYDIRLLGHTGHDAELQVVDVGRDIFLNSIQATSIAAGGFEMLRKLRARAESANLMIKVRSSRLSNARLFGVEIKEVQI